MTDKQIIIDGVDVSGCIYYDANADKESYFLHDCKKEHAPCWSCSSMPSCLYKKYKRKEQECEELKIYIESNEQQVKEVETLVMDNGRLINELDQLKQTLNEIKEIAEKEVNNRMLFADKESFCDFNKILQKISEALE